MNLTKLRCLLFTAVFLPALSEASVFLRPMALYLYNSQTVSGTSSGSSRMLFDASVGYMSDHGWLLGAIYQNDSQRTSYGPSVGWSTSKDLGPFVAAHYFYKVKDQAAGPIDGSGYQADFGIRAQLSKFVLAFQVAYKHYSYGSSSSSLGGVEAETRVDPSIGLFITF
ncbi:MAG: hypothetical protein ABIO95_07620 [Bdellovibrionota bacterium]